MIFTYVENVSYITEVPKFIEVERSDERSMHNFVKELNEMCIYEQLQPALDAIHKKTTIYLLNQSVVLKTNTCRRKLHD